jgi:hypothetical protein
MLVFAGCGGGGSTNTATIPTATTSASALERQPVANTAYSVKLTTKGDELPAGAPEGSGTALIGINGADHELCWTFAKIKTLQPPTSASLQGNIKVGRTMTALGEGYHASGCRRASPIILNLIERQPERFVVVLAHRGHPFQSLHGRL